MRAVRLKHFLLFGLIIANAAWAEKSVNFTLMLESLLKARQQQAPAVVLSAKFEQPYDERLAYQLQSEFVKTRLAGAEPAGFKAGLTTKAAQKKFNVDGPVAGVLLESPLSSSNLVLEQGSYHRMMLEMELGFRLKQSVSSPLKNIDSVKALVAEVMPVLEVPDLGFDTPKALTGEDIIASNVAAAHWVLGEALSPHDININQLSFNLRLNNKTLMQGDSGDVMEDQWQALLWLINRSVESGWVIQPDQLLITGAVGKMVPATPGSYRADFSNLGVIAFSIKP